MPVGIVHSLFSYDIAWLFQPYLAFLAAMLALTLYAILERLIFRPALRAGAAFVAAQPAILYGYSLWGGIKELAGAWLLALIAALAPRARLAGRPRALRRRLPRAPAQRGAGLRPDRSGYRRGYRRPLVGVDAAELGAARLRRDRGDRLRRLRCGQLAVGRGQDAGDGLTRIRRRCPGRLRRGARPPALRSGHDRGRRDH